MEATYLKSLAKHGHMIRLKQLRVVGMQADDIAAFAKCIAKIDSLESISVPRAYSPLLVSLRENGNIQEMQVDYSLGASVDKLANAYCERNAHLDDLLQESSTPPEDDDTDNKTGKSFCPTLWQAAEPMTKERTSKLIRSLLGLCESVAPP
jgi:hypothetical protein